MVDQNMRTAWIVAAIIIAAIIVAAAISKASAEPERTLYVPPAPPAVQAPDDPASWSGTSAEADCWASGGTWVAGTGTCL